MRFPSGVPMQKLPFKFPFPIRRCSTSVLTSAAGKPRTMRQFEGRNSAQGSSYTLPVEHPPPFLHYRYLAFSLSSPFGGSVPAFSFLLVMGPHWISEISSFMRVRLGTYCRFIGIASLSLFLSVYLLVNVSICPCVCLYVSVSVYQSASLSLSVSLLLYYHCWRDNTAF